MLQRKIPTILEIWFPLDGRNNAKIINICLILHQPIASSWILLILAYQYLEKVFLSFFDISRFVDLYVIYSHWKQFQLYQWLNVCTFENTCHLSNAKTSTIIRKYIACARGETQIPNQM